jgi:hypothetical protein
MWARGARTHGGWGFGFLSIRVAMGASQNAIHPLVWAQRGPIAARVFYGFSVPTAKGAFVFRPKRAPRGAGASGGRDRDEWSGAPKRSGEAARTGRSAVGREGASALGTARSEAEG